LIQLFRGIFSQGTWHCKCSLFENYQKASRAAQNALAGRVFETPVLNSTSGAMNSVPPNKSVYLSAKPGLLKATPESN